MTFQEWQELHKEVRTRAENISQSIIKRCRKLSLEAGLDPGLLGIHPHNAMVSLHYGKPWPGVDYSKVRKIQWLLNERQWRGYELAEKISSRAWNTVPR